MVSYYAKCVAHWELMSLEQHQRKKRLELLKKQVLKLISFLLILGAEHVILYTSQDVVSEVKRVTNNVGVNVVYDGVGKSTLDASLASLKTRGWLVVYGNASGKVVAFI